MEAKIISKIVTGFSYLLFALSLIILCIDKAAAIMLLTVSFGTFLLGGFLRTLSENDSQIKTVKKEEGKNSI